MKLAFFDTKPYDKPGFDAHIAGTDIVASMTVFVDGKPKKSDYKRFSRKTAKDTKKRRL